jgi:hypothetical protein
MLYYNLKILQFYFYFYGFGLAFYVFLAKFLEYHHKFGLFVIVCTKIVEEVEFYHPGIFQEVYITYCVLKQAQLC